MRKTLRLFGLSVLLLFLASLLQAQIPIPPPPKPVKLVNDLAQILSKEEEYILETELRRYEDSTSTQIAIVSVKTTEGYPMYEFSTELGRAWGIGQKSKNNGVIILWATEDREIFIAPGYGLEGALPDAVCRRIIENEILPYFKEKRFFEGLAAGIIAITKAAEGEYKAETKNRKKEEVPLWFIILAILVAIPLLFTRWGRAFFLMMLLTSGRGGHSISSGRGGGGSFGGGFGGGSFGGGGAGGRY